MYVRLVCRTRYHPSIILLLCCFSLCRSSRHSFLFPFFKGLTSIGETKRLQTAENRMSTDDNYLQKLNSHLFKSYRARDAFNRLTSMFENTNPFKNRPKAARSLSTNSSPKINSYFHKNKSNLDDGQDLKPPNAIVSPRNRTYFHQLIDDEHPILIKNNHGKLRDFVKYKPLVTVPDSVSITSRTTASLLELFNNKTSTSKRINIIKENNSEESTSEETLTSKEVEGIDEFVKITKQFYETSTQPTVFGDETNTYKISNTSLMLSNKDEDKTNIIKPIKEWNNHHSMNHHLNNHNSNPNHMTHLSSDKTTLHLKSTASPMINHRLTTSSHKHTTLLSPHRTPAHVIITKKGNYTTNNSSKYFATPSYNLDKKKPVRFSLKPFVISTHDTDKKQVYSENDNPIKVNSYEDMDISSSSISYSTTAMPMDSYEISNNNLNVKHPDHPQLIVHHSKNPQLTKTKLNSTVLSINNNQRNNTKIANISKWPLRPQKINTKTNTSKVHLISQQISSSTASSEEDDHTFFTQLQSQHQANKSPFQHHYNYSNSVTQRPILQVTQLNAVYTKPESDFVHSDAITVMDHDSSEQQQFGHNPQTSTTIMHNNLVVSYKPGRPLPNNVQTSAEQQLLSTTPSYNIVQQINEQFSQNNILSNKRPDNLKLPSQTTNIKSNYTLTKLPKPPIKHKPIQLNITNNSSPNKINHNVNKSPHQTPVQQSSSSAQPPRRVGILKPFSQTSQQTQQQEQQQLISSTHNHTSSHIHHNTTSGHHHHHSYGYIHAINAPPMPSMPISTPSPQIVNRNPLLAWLGVDSLTQLFDRSFLFRTFVVILTILLLPPLTVVAAITSIG